MWFLLGFGYGVVVTSLVIAVLIASQPPKGRD